MNREQCWCSDECATPYGTCHCGCGKATTIAPQNSTDRGWVKGRPIFYVKGHAPRPSVQHVLSGIDETTRTAICDRCKQVVSIKRDAEKKIGWKCCGRLMTDHRLSSIDPKEKTAYCRGCQKRVDVISGGTREKSPQKRWKCGVFSRALARAYREDGAPNALHTAWREANRDELHLAHVARNYGLSPEAYTKLLDEQDSRCAICRRLPTGGPRDRVLHVDHRHDNGLVRGLLCHHCNQALGLFNDDPELLAAAIAYLSRTVVENG